MSRIMRSFYEFKDDYVFNNLEKILLKYKDNLDSFDAKIGLNFLILYLNLHLDLLMKDTSTIKQP